MDGVRRWPSPRFGVEARPVGEFLIVGRVEVGPSWYFHTVGSLAREEGVPWAQMVLRRVLGVTRDHCRARVVGAAVTELPRVPTSPSPSPLRSRAVCRPLRPLTSRLAGGPLSLPTPGLRSASAARVTPLRGSSERPPNRPPCC